MAEQKRKSALEPHGYILEDEEDRNLKGFLSFSKWCIMAINSEFGAAMQGKKIWKVVVWIICFFDFQCCFGLQELYFTVFYFP